jgi:YD repeat-containing protein
MKARLYLSGGFVLLFMLVSCSKDKHESGPNDENKAKIRLLEIIKTTYEGSFTSTTYHYNTSDQLVEIKNDRFNQKFTYADDGSLAFYERKADGSHLYFEYRYENDRLDQVIRKSFAGSLSFMDTTHYYYDTEGKIVRSFLSYNMDYNYTCNDQGKIIMRTGTNPDSSWCSWDAGGNLGSRIFKGWDPVNGGFNTTTVTYTYADAKNFMNAVPYPETYLFIRSLDPSPVESTMQYLSHPSGDLFPLDFPYYGTLTLLESNGEQYPVKFSCEETSWELVYETY